MVKKSSPSTTEPARKGSTSGKSAAVVAAATPAPAAASASAKMNGAEQGTSKQGVKQGVPKPVKLARHPRLMDVVTKCGPASVFASLIHPLSLVRHFIRCLYYCSSKNKRPVHICGCYNQAAIPQRTTNYASFPVSFLLPHAFSITFTFVERVLLRLLGAQAFDYQAFLPQVLRRSL